ncbi:DNA repair protein RecO [Candidatus Kuenenbacteria bacterium]|nr:DNA repair protein RecO [Candidatus Kuenenbacteria bacterium]
MFYKTIGIILKRENFRENDRLITIYTRDYGKIETIAYGTRKIKSKLAGHLEPFTLVDLIIVKGKNFDKIIGSRTINSFCNLKFDLIKIKQGAQILKTVDVMTKVHFKDEKIFRLLKETLEMISLKQESARITMKSTNQSDYLTYYFILHFLSLLGYTPELYQCVHCKIKIKPFGNVFSFKFGGLLCQKCKPLAFFKKVRGKEIDLNVLNISTNAIKILRLMLKEKKLKKINPSADGLNLFQEIKKIIDLFLLFLRG